MNGPDVNDKDVGLCLVNNDAYVGTEDHARVRGAMNHFVKDWSEEERREWCQTFGPVLDALKIFEGEVSGRRRKKVLVPGAGLGRLAWEISQLGFDTTANERSHFMNLAAESLLSPQTRRDMSQHRLHPFTHWWSRTRSNFHS